MGFESVAVRLFSCASRRMDAADEAIEADLELGAVENKRISGPRDSVDLL